MILLDYSGLIHANIHAFTKNLERGSLKENEDLIRHIVLTSILTIRKKFKRAKYGDLVIACDGGNYWRKTIFPHYKASRKKAREASKIDWTTVFKIIDELSIDIERVFPYKIIQVNGAEADDIIAVLTKYTQDNEMSHNGLYPEAQRVIAISEDMDFMQLFKYENFELYHPRKGKLATKLSSQKLLEFTRSHIAYAGDDGIPTILCDDDHFVKEVKVRAPPMKAARLDQFKSHGRDACIDDLERKRWDRNQRLIDFDFIPNDISAAIVTAYHSSNSKIDRNSIFEYLVSNGCRQLLNDVELF